MWHFAMTALLCVQVKSLTNKMQIAIIRDLSTNISFTTLILILLELTKAPWNVWSVKAKMDISKFQVSANKTNFLDWLHSTVFSKRLPL